MGLAPAAPTIHEVDGVELVRTDLPAEPASVRTARHLVFTAVQGWADDELVDAALVVTSELATNAALHALTGFTLVVLRHGATLRIEVHDGSARLPRRKHYSESSATGRGLLLVEALSNLAGADRTDRGKVVWAVLGDTAEGRPSAGDPGANLGVVAPRAGRPTSLEQVAVACETPSQDCVGQQHPLALA